jgi:hypothetical protein
MLWFCLDKWPEFLKKLLVTQVMPCMPLRCSLSGQSIRLKIVGSNPAMKNLFSSTYNILFAIIFATIIKKIAYKHNQRCFR